jgi:membrane protein DedA with SNARE-associated domain
VLHRAAVLIYLSIFSALVAAGVGFPIPEEVPIVTGGWLVGHASGKHKILLVTKDFQLSDSIARFLDEDGRFEVRLATTDLDAGMMVVDSRPDLIVLDVTAPEISGEQLCQRLRSDSALEDMKILCIIGMAEDSKLERLKHAGVDQFLYKPFTIEQFIDRVSTLLKIEAAPVPLRWWIMLPLCILGVVVSDGLLYGMGRLWGPRLLDSKWMRRLVPPERRRRIEGNFHEYGVLVLLFARFLPTIRSPIFIMAGTMRLPFTKFLLADGLYAIPGVSLLFFLAFWFGDQFRDLVFAAEGKVQALRPVLILLLIAGVAAYLFFHFVRHPVATGDPREELPVIGEQVAKITSPETRQAHVVPADFSRADRSGTNGPPHQTEMDSERRGLAPP